VPLHSAAIQIHAHNILSNINTADSHTKDSFKGTAITFPPISGPWSCEGATHRSMSTPMIRELGVTQDYESTQNAAVLYGSPKINYKIHLERVLRSTNNPFQVTGFKPLKE
jgi:hypothetical protein